MKASFEIVRKKGSTWGPPKEKAGGKGRKSKPEVNNTLRKFVFAEVSEDVYQERCDALRT